MLKLAILLLIGMVLVEANIVKRAVKQAHATKMQKRQQPHRMGLGRDDEDLCQWMDLLGDSATTCDGPPSDKPVYCYLTDWQCDGEFDCYDHSDEENCKGGKGRKKGRKNQ